MSSSRSFLSVSDKILKSFVNVDRVFSVHKPAVDLDGDGFSTVEVSSCTIMTSMDREQI